MTTCLFLLCAALTTQPPELGPAPSEVLNEATITAWLVDLGSKDIKKQWAAHDALVKAGPKAKTAVPNLIKMLSGNDANTFLAIEVLGAIGPDARDALPALLERVKPQAYGGNSQDALAVAIARIDTPRPECTRSLLLSSSKGAAIILSRSQYLHRYLPQVIPHIIELCADKDPIVRTKAATVLGDLKEPVQVNPGPPPVWKPLIELATDSAKDISSTLEKLLRDEDSNVRIATAEAISRVAPQLAEKSIPVVIALVKEEKLTWENNSRSTLLIFSPLRGQAVNAILPLFDSDKPQARKWAIYTLGYLFAKAQLETALKEGKTARVREAAAIALSVQGSHHPESVPALTQALADHDFIVRFAAAHALLQVIGRGSTATEKAVPTLIEGLKQDIVTSRLTAASDLLLIGPAAKKAIPDLKALLDSREAKVALEAALAIAAIDPAETADAIPVLILGLQGNDAVFSRVARALGKLGPRASAAVPSLTAKWDAKDIGVRLAAATATCQIDPAQAEKVTQLLVGIMGDSAYRYSYRVKAITALGEIGPGAKSALPLLLESLNDKKSPFRAEMALAAISIDPEAGKPALLWLHEQLSKPGDDTYDIMEQLQRIGTSAKVLLPEVIAMLDDRSDDYRLYAIEALMAIGPDARDSLPKLKEIAAKDTRPNIRQTAADAIRKIEAK